jgi:ABC-2 type transport system ATP-binding protein
MLYYGYNYINDKPKGGVLMNDIIVNVKNFRKTYGSFTAVKDISFEVRKGEIFGILGPNGAGKTSTLECLEGLRTPDGGTMEIMGINPASQSGKLRDIIGVQLQASGLPDSITVREAMKLFSSYHRTAPRYDLLERIGLGNKLSTQYHALSGGMQRRLVLALAIAHNPTLLILDEPTAALDVQSRVELHSLMSELKERGTTIILATHDMAEAEKMADRIAILLKGQIVILGTPKEITSTGAGLTKISVRTMNASLQTTALQFQNTMNHSVKDEYFIYYTAEPGPVVTEIINYINFKNDTLIDLRVERPSLEERFLEITGVGGAK